MIAATDHGSNHSAPLMLVLLVEDTRMMAIAMQNHLKALEVVQTHVAPSAEDAMMMASSTLYDLFLVDVGLPKMSGLDFVRWLRTQPLYTETPVIMTTGDDRTESVLASRQAGANAYLVKPIAKDLLLKRVVAYSMTWMKMPLPTGMQAPKGKAFMGEWD